MVSYNNERDLSRIIEDLQKRLKTLEGSTTGPQTLEERAEIRKPAAPTGFTVSSYVDFNTAGQAQSIIKGTWYPVKITNGYNDSYYTEIKIRCYELWAKESNLSDDYYQVVATTDAVEGVDEISVTFIAMANKEYSVKVTAIGQDYNTRGEWSSVQTISAIDDTTPPDIPTPPIVTDGSGAAKIMWDGLPIMPVDFNYVEVGYHTLPTSSPEIVGRLYNSTNTVIITPEYDEKTYYYLRAVDYSGNSSSWSPVTIATIQQPPLSEGNKDEISTMLEELDNNIQRDITSIVNDVTTASDMAKAAKEAADDAIVGTSSVWATSDSETVVPTAGWSSNAPIRTPGTYIWQKTTVTYGDGTTSAGSPVLITGNDGQSVSITSITPYYYLQDKYNSTAPTKPANNTVPGTGWTTTEPDFDATKELYRTDYILFSNGNSTCTEVNKNSSYQGIREALELAGSKANVRVSETAPGEEFENEDSLWLDIKDRHYAWTGNENASSSTESDGVNGVIRENKATNPRFKGLSGDTVEVRRNRALNAGARSLTNVLDVSAWSYAGNLSAEVVSADWSLSGSAIRSTFADTTASSVTQVKNLNDSKRGITAGIWTVVQHVRYAHDSMFSDNVSFTEPGTDNTLVTSGYENLGNRVHKNWATINVTNVDWTGSPRIDFFLNSSTIAVGDWVEISMIDIYPGAYDPQRDWFDGSYSPDPDLTPSWTGTENASASVLKGEAVANTLEGASITYRSQHGIAIVPDGMNHDTKTAVAGSLSGFSGQGVTFTPGKWYGASAITTLTKTLLNIGPSAARIIQASNTVSGWSGSTQSLSESTPNAPGAYQKRLVWQCPTDSIWNSLYLYNGSSNPADIVYWDKLFIVDGDSEEEVRYKLANGFFDGNSTNTPANTVKYWDDTEKAWIPSQTNKAQETADKAIAAAAEAFSAANLVQAAMNGLISTGYTQPVDPVKGSLWFQQRTDDDAIIGLYIYNGSQWKDYTLIANKLYVLGAGGAVYIGDGLVKSNSIATEAVETKHLGSNTVTTEKLSTDVIEVLNKADAWATKTTIDSNGITISNGENSLRLTETQLKFLVGDTPVAWIDSVTQNMTIDTLSIATSITVGHHKIEKYVIQGSSTPTGITIIRQGA